MKNDVYGQVIIDEDDLCALYMVDKSRIVKRALVENPIKFDSYLELKNIPELTVYEKCNLTIEEFDAKCQSFWYMPEEYKNLDIALYVLEKCKTDVERDRVGQELLLYLERNLFMLLKYCVYLVDLMRTNNIVCGLGRGSSVSSYVLFLIGMHRIDSIKYDLDIGEFLR